MSEQKKRIVTPSASPPAGPSSQAVVAGGFVFVAGQRPQDPATGKVGETIQEQTRQVIRNLDAILTAAGSGLDWVVRTTVYLSDIKDFAPMNEIYREMMPQPFPVRTTFGAQLQDDLIKIDVTAVLNGADYSPFGQRQKK